MISDTYISALFSRKMIKVCDVAAMLKTAEQKPSTAHRLQHVVSYVIHRLERYVVGYVVAGSSVSVPSGSIAVKTPYSMVPTNPPN